MGNIEIGNRIEFRRKQLNLTLDDIASEIGVAKSTVQRYEKGTIEKIKLPVIEAIARVLDVDPAWLCCKTDVMGTAPNKSIPSNILPMPNLVKKPRLGNIACGKPILAVEDAEEFDMVPEDIECDFTLRCKGDSMINARIFDGDTVYIRIQPEVENGEIAAVRIEDEATLKKVYYTPGSDRITLRACNPMYPDLVYDGESLNEIEILGKAVAFTSIIKY